MDAQPQWISLRAYARGRNPPVALSAVQKAIDSGRVTAVRRDAKGRLTGIDRVKADQEWLKNTDPDQAARTQGIHPASERGAQLAGPSAAEQLAPASGNRDEPAAQLKLQPQGDERAEDGPLPAGGAAAAKEENGKDFGYLEARAKREQFQAKQAELDYLEAIGELVPKAELTEAATKRYRAIRDKLLNIPDRLSAILAAEKDPIVVHTTLAKEIKQVLHELSDDARAEAARGVAESVAA